MNQTKSNMIPSLCLAVGCLFVLALGGCSTVGHEIVPTGARDTLGPVPGDRDDVPRALPIGLEAAEAALLSGAWDGDTYTASFLIVEDREGVATATDHGDGTLTLTAFVEPGGDLVAQRRLLKAWARRLEQLHGVEWAPR